jgi:exopolysaccharide biosynthesis predicted pyruvyltransferase EpsI
MERVTRESTSDRTVVLQLFYKGPLSSSYCHISKDTVGDHSYLRTVTKEDQVSRKRFSPYRVTIVKNTWKRGRPVWPRLLSYWNRVRRVIVCVLQNVVVFHPTGRLHPVQWSIVTAISLGVTDTFDGPSNTTYKHWLEMIQPLTRLSMSPSSYLAQHKTQHGPRRPTWRIGSSN